MQIPSTALSLHSWRIWRPGADSSFGLPQDTDLTMTNKIHIPQQACFKSCGTFITFWPRCREIYERHFRFVCCPPTTSLVKPCCCSQVHFNFLVEWCKCDVLGGFVMIRQQKRWFTELKETESRTPDWDKTQGLCCQDLLCRTGNTADVNLIRISARFHHPHKSLNTQINDWGHRGPEQTTRNHFIVTVNGKKKKKSEE